MDEKISNNHLIYCKCEYANHQQITEIIQDAMIEGGINGSFYVNVVTKAGNLCRYAYIWAVEKPVFDYIISFQDQGYTTTKRSVVIDNPDYKPKVLSGALGNSTSSLDGSTSSFGYDELKEVICDDTDDWVSPNRTKTAFEDTKISLQPVTYLPDQINEIQKRNPEWPGNPYTLIFDRAMYEDLRDIEDSDDSESDQEDDKIIHNKWVATNIPDFVNLNILLKYLRPFVTDPSIKGTLTFNGKRVKMPYPHINIKNTKNNKNKIVYVTFNPGSTDGQFALYMCRQLKVEHDGNKGTLYFNHFIRKGKSDERND